MSGDNKIETVCTKCNGAIQGTDPRFCKKCMDFADARLDDLRKENARKGKIIEDLMAQGERANLKLTVKK